MKTFETIKTASLTLFGSVCVFVWVIVEYLDCFFFFYFFIIVIQFSFDVMAKEVFSVSFLRLIALPRDSHGSQAELPISIITAEAKVLTEMKHGVAC